MTEQEVKKLLHFYREKFLSEKMISEYESPQEYNVIREFSGFIFSRLDMDCIYQDFMAIERQENIEKQFAEDYKKNAIPSNDELIESRREAGR